MDDPGQPPFWGHPLTRAALTFGGISLMIVGMLIGPLPGPGFLVLFPVGLAIVLKNATWSKRIYLRLRRRYPEYGRWTDWALRRPRHKEMPPPPPWREGLVSLWRGIRNSPQKPGRDD
ncbi:MAG: hypothetical protein GW859_04480 [Sphingomonadales bacterium]|nr:hypothetical protein [Sphingomonadales bacterium]